MRCHRFCGGGTMCLVASQDDFRLRLHPGALEEILVHPAVQADRVLQCESPEVLRTHEASVDQFMRLLQDSAHVFHIEVADV